MTVKWQLVAQVQAVDHSNRRTFWHDVKVGGRRMVRCTCGGAVRDNPGALTYEESWGGCSHIVALYKGDVTTDKREAYARKLVRLTERGLQMFAWRWVTRGLQRT